MPGAQPPSPEEFALPQSPTPERSASLPEAEAIAPQTPGPGDSEQPPATLPPPPEAPPPTATAAIRAEFAGDGSAPSGSRAAAVVAAPPDDWVGRTISSYEIVAKLGQGGMGVVYKGRQISLDRTVAIKVLSKALSDNQEFIKRFEREAKSIARIHHPNIVAVYDFGRFEGTWFMVSEFVEGESLATMIGERIMLTVEEVQPLVEQCLAALASVSAMGVVHRDIKPDNIIVTRDGVAKLLDFGLAKDVSGSNDATDLTGSGLAMGTPAYMSPEQCMGRKLDGRSDIYALGVTAYYALTGEKPFTGQSSFEIMTRQREHMPPPPHTLNPRIPPEASAIVMRMLAKNPIDRYPDAETCRLEWVALDDRLAPGTAPARAEPAPSRLSGRTPLPILPDKPVALPPVPAVAPPAVPATQQSGLIRSPRPETGRRPGASDPPDSRTGSERVLRPGSDTRRAKGDPQPCPKCGHVNRPDAASCVRCLTSLRSTDAAAKDLLPEAERLLEQGAYAESAALFARLADAESDRKVRSVLRIKERDARRRAQGRQEQEHLQRARHLAEHGDLRAALHTITEAQAQLPRDPGSTSVSGLDAMANELRAGIAARRRRTVLATVIAAIVVAGLAAVAVALKLGKS